MVITSVKKHKSDKPLTRELLKRTKGHCENELLKVTS
jgi:hypothetical protein